MDDVSTCKDATERSFPHEEDGENEELENSGPIADDFDSYDCFMQPFDSPDEGDEETKGLEMEYFDQIDKNNSNHKVATRFFFMNNLQEHMIILRAICYLIMAPAILLAKQYMSSYNWS